MHTLLFMGSEDHVDDVRCRIYGDDTDAQHNYRVSFLRSCAGEGVIDCPAYDGFVAALQKKGWLPPCPELEPNPEGKGRIARWRLTDIGRSEAAEFIR